MGLHRLDIIPADQPVILTMALKCAFDKISGDAAVGRELE